MSNQNLTDRTSEIDQMVENRNLAIPIGIDYAKDLSLDELKHLRHRLYWRVYDLTREDFGVINATASLELIGKNHPYRRIFKTATPGGNPTIYYRGVKVLDAQTADVTLGKWIDELRDFANQIRAQEEIQKIISLRHERESLIKTLTAVV